ncbi:MAG TPA: divalent-cation tolerance protein CutA [Candidatus Binatia bacterium]|nr:divalent-cation tolerance protein CutA [Candidatus Binatia bacterium]
MAQDVLVVLVTCPPDKADGLAHALVERRLAACVNVVPHLASVYRWQGSVHRDSEALLVVKTPRDRFDALKQAVLELHPCDLPEMIALDVERGHVPYLEWVIEATR